MNTYLTFATLGTITLLSACSMAPREIPTTGHIADGVYVLPPEEAAYTCAEFDGATRYSVRQAFAKVGEGNRQAVLTMASNLFTFGMGGIPRGLNFGSRERQQGRQELTKALALDNAARANGCDGVDIPALVDAELGEGSLAKVVEDRKEDKTGQNSVLAEESALKSQVR